MSNPALAASILYSNLLNRVLAKLRFRYNRLAGALKMGAESLERTLIAVFSIITIFDTESTLILQSIARQEHRQSGRRRDYSRRPPTPPYVRFRIRRFM